MDRVKRIWYLSLMRAAKVQASLRIRAVWPEPPLLAHTRSESRGTVRQKSRSLAPLNGWACAIKICNDGMLEDTDSLDGAQMKKQPSKLVKCLLVSPEKHNSSTANIFTDYRYSVNGTSHFACFMMFQFLFFYIRTHLFSSLFL